MSEKKIVINPELFKVDGGSRKKKSKDPSQKQQKIKVKSEITPAKSRSIKRNVLKIIRAKQQDEFKRLFSNDATKKPKSKQNLDVVESEFNTDFENSLKYLSDLAEKTPQPKEPLNHTFKQYANVAENVSLEMPPEFSIPVPVETDVKTVLPTQMTTVPPVSIGVHPGWGCMKNGRYPTYRTWRNQNGIEQKIPVFNALPPVTAPYPAPNFSSPVISSPKPFLSAAKPDVPSSLNPSLTPASHTQTSSAVPSIASHTHMSQESLPTFNTSNSLIKMMQMQKKHDTSSKPVQKIRNMRRKKIYKRTYRVGRSKVAPKISCLISNKTVRQKIQQNVYDLKHADIKTVRKFLLKKGFIRVGTVAPNDVLRKMYESVATICGDVENHNADNLLYNYMNDKD